MNKGRSKFPSGVALIATLGALVAVAIAAVAGAETPVSVQTSNVSVKVNGGFSPKLLSKTVATPIALRLSGQIKTLDGTQPPALKELILQTDSAGAINLKGVPSCNPKTQYQFNNQIDELCKGSVIGEGTTQIEVSFPGLPTTTYNSKLRIVKNGSILYAMAAIGAPHQGVIFSTITIKHIHQGRFGTEIIVSVPEIVGGSGSVTSFSLTISKKFHYQGRSVSPLTLKCPDGRILARGIAIFRDGTHASFGVRRACIS